MIREVLPSCASGVTAAPPSKSMAHRLAICAGLAEGESIIHGVSLSEDISATLDCLTALGAACTMEGDTVFIRGTNPARSGGAVLPCRECGSTLRFFLPLCLLGGETHQLTGSERLLSRPMTVYEELCRSRGIAYSADGKAITVKGRLTPGTYTVRGDVSSQFISGLMFALPLLGGESRIVITGKIESRSYIDLTRAAMTEFGVTVLWQDENTLLIPADALYQPRELTVEGDYSNAAFPDAFNLIGGHVTVTGLKPDSLQGDRVYQRLFPALAAGCPEISLADCPDLGPILFALAAVLHGGVFTDTARLRIKESDRGEAMAQELAKLGVKTVVEDNRITVYPGKLHTPAVPLDGHNDHRVVMALAILLTKVGGSITGAEAVAKSFPDFWDKLTELGIQVK